MFIAMNRFRIVKGKEAEFERCCQSNANQSPNLAMMVSSGRQLTPFGQCGGAGFLECVAAIQVAVMVEMVVDRSMGRSEFLQRLDVPEPGHRTFSSAERLM